MPDKDDKTIEDVIPGPRNAGPYEQRLHAALLAAQGRLLALRQNAKPSPESNPNFQAALRCWQMAVKHASEKATYIAWDCLHQFDDVLIAEMSAEERAAYWCTLGAEADEKLGGWRAKARVCLGKSVVDGTPVSAIVARQLHGHLATSAQNLQLKLTVFETLTLPMLVRLLAMVILAAIFGALIVIWQDPSAHLRSWAQALLLAIGAGGLGGVLSMTFSLGRTDLSAKIPASRLTGPATAIRPLLGAAVAIPILVFVNTGFVSVKGLSGNLAIFAFCFLGGFSERWFIELIERFETAAGSGKKKDPEGPPAPAAPPAGAEPKPGVGGSRLADASSEAARTPEPAKK